MLEANTLPQGLMCSNFCVSIRSKEVLSIEMAQHLKDSVSAQLLRTSLVCVIKNKQNLRGQDACKC